MWNRFVTVSNNGNRVLLKIISASASASPSFPTDSKNAESVTIPSVLDSMEKALSISRLITYLATLARDPDFFPLAFHPLLFF